MMLRPLLKTTILILLSCLTITAQKSAANTYSQYSVINNKDADEFVRQAMKYSQQLYGTPAIPVRQVILRYGKDQAFTGITDKDKGIFTIVLAHQPSEFSFYGLLAHETGHLLNARLIDCYAEGLSTLFSEKMLIATGKDWASWENYYRQGKEPFYGTTYFMLEDIENIVGESGLRNILSYAVDNTANLNMHIDINSWIKSMPAGQRAQIKAAILKNALAVQKQRVGVKAKYSFELPR